MDQSKWAIPRNHGTRTSKSMACLPKPKCKVQGIWAHGALLKLYVLDPRVPSDSSTIVESLASSFNSSEWSFAVKLQVRA